MKKNILYILLIIIFLLVIVSLVLVIINLYNNRSKTPIPAPQPIEEKVVSRQKTIDFSKYDITPREAMYYE